MKTKKKRERYFVVTVLNGFILKSLDYKTLQKACIKEKAYISRCQAILLKAQMLLF